MTETTYDHKAAIREVCASGWSLTYPQWVREAFTKALKTDGALPPYAEAHVAKALRVAGRINERNENAVLVRERQARPITGNNKAAARKADKRARDREIRMRMKSPKGSKS